VAFLFLELPPDQVDVNVHPTKVEVRFRETQALYHLVLATVRDRLRAQNLTPRLQPPSSDQRPWAAGNGAQEIPWLGNRQPQPNGDPQPTASGVATEMPTPTPFPLPATSAVKAIQLYESYLVLETTEGMLVIDQHALHERILFEQLKKRLRSGSLEVQRLLIPEPIDLTAEQASRTLEHQEALQELGLGVQDFGGGTLLLTSYPAILGNRSPRSILLAVVDHLVTKEQAPNREQLLNNLLSLMACHAAVKAGDHLTAEEIEALIAQRDLATDAHHCPHGRPTALLFSRQELERQFRRS
jgi:DNA mismatch repair protein MutL